jgi:hypothetical protein
MFALTVQGHHPQHGKGLYQKRSPRGCLWASLVTAAVLLTILGTEASVGDSDARKGGVGARADAKAWQLEHRGLTGCQKVLGLGHKDLTKVFGACRWATLSHFGLMWVLGNPMEFVTLDTCRSGALYSNTGTKGIRRVSGCSQTTVRHLRLGKPVVA